VMRLLFRNIKQHLPLGIGEEKVKDVLAENIPDWIFGLGESDLKAFVEALQQDPEFYRCGSSSGCWKRSCTRNDMAMGR
jgi:hypothetical protein